MSRDEDLIFKAHAAAYEYYRHAPIMPGIDIYNLEPEAYGAVVEQPEGHAIPAIGVHPLDNVAALLELPPLDPATDGRIPMQIRAAQRLIARFPDANIRVPVSGPFSIASLLLGFDALLMATVLEPEMMFPTWPGPPPSKVSIQVPSSRGL